MSEAPSAPQGSSGDTPGDADSVEKAAATTEAAPPTGDSGDADKWKAMARKHEAAAKANAAKAAEFDKLQEANKSESQKLADRIKELESENQSVKLSLLRTQVARDKALAPELAEVLQGTTVEEMSDHADKLKLAVERDYAPKKAPDPDKTGAGATGSNGPDVSDPDALARAALRR